MTRRFTGLCIAGAFAFAASAAAQSTTTTSQRSSDTPGHEVSVTGCLAKSGDGSYMLTSARVEPAGSASTTTAGAATTGSTATTAGSTTTAEPRGTSGSSMSATTWVLQGGSDLDTHVGHKVTVTGNATWNPGSSPASDPTVSASGTAGSTAGSAVGTTGSTATGTATGEPRSSTSPSGRASSSNPRLEVQSVKMVSTTCS